MTSTAQIWLDAEGIVREVAIAGSEHDADEARENIAAQATAGRGTRRPLLVDMSQVRSISRQARVVYATEGSRSVCAVALVVGSPLSRMMGNFFLGFNRPLVPTRLFSSTDDAMIWLRQFLLVADSGAS